MRCPFCNKENPDGAKFCGGCGKNLEQINFSGNKDGKNRPSEQLHTEGISPDGGKATKKKMPAVIIAAAAAVIVIAVIAIVFLKQRDGTDTSDADYYYQEIDPERICEEEGMYYIESQILLVAEQSASFDDVRDFLSDYDGEIVGYLSFTNDYQADLSGTYSYDELEELCDEMEESELIETATPALVDKLTTESIDYTSDSWINADDTSDTSGSDWDEDNPDGLNWWAEAIGMPSVWAMDLKLETVKVGIIDSMFDIDNEDLDEGLFVQLWNNPEDEDGNCTVTDLSEAGTDDSGHGTHVAGIIAAQAENGFGIAGVSSNAELYGYAWLTEEYSAADEAVWGDIFTYKYAIALMLDQGVKVINISMGSGLALEGAAAGEAWALVFLETNSSALCEFLSKYIDAGYEFLICKCAGNESLDASYDIFAAIDEEEVSDRIIIVGAADYTYTDSEYDEDISCVAYTTAYFSNTGESVDVYAPGMDILSDVPSNETALKSGTSMATPIVTGLAALIWGINPDLSASQVKEIIVTSSEYMMPDSSDYISIVNARICAYLAQITVGLTDNSELSYGTVMGGIYTVNSDGNIEYGTVKDAIINIYDEDENIVSAGSSETMEYLSAELQDGTTVLSSAWNVISYAALLEPGTYTVEISADGYETQSQTVTISEGETLQLDFALQEEAESDELEIYAEILDLLYYGISSQWTNYDKDSLYYGEEFIDVCYLWYWFAEDEDLSLSDAGFAFIDLDGDGVSELLVDIFDDEDGGHGSGIRDLYTYRDGEIIHLAAEGERWDYWLCSDYSVAERGSGSASTGGYNYYKVSSDSDGLVLIESLDYEYEDEPIWFYSDDADASEYSTSEMTVISDDEAQVIIDSYEALDYDLTPFSEYTPSGEAAQTGSASKAYYMLANFVDTQEYMSAISLVDYGYDSFEDYVDEGHEIYYVLADLNADGVSELLICADDGIDFYFTWTFVYYQGEVCLINEFYGYGQYRYSSAYNAVVVPCETGHDASTDTVNFYQIDGSNFNWLFSLIYDTGTWYYSDSSGTEAMDTTYSESEYSEGIENLEWISVG